MKNEMKHIRKKLFTRLRERHRHVSMGVILLNLLLLAGISVSFIYYNNIYKQRLKDENIDNIISLNQSAAVSTVSLFSNWTTKLNDILQYVQIKDLSHDEVLEMLADSNSSDQRFFELIGKDYKGFLAQKDQTGAYLPLDYSSSSYDALHKIFDHAGENGGKTFFAPEYTDGGETAEKFFAMCQYIPLRDESGEKQYYTLMLASPATNILDVLNQQYCYVGQSTVMINATGNYVVSNKDFKSSNFFQFLYVYNDLSLDQKTEIIQEMKRNGRGELYYKNAGQVVEDCVYCYTKVGRDGWYCITCVPLSSFQTPVFSTRYIIVSLLMIMLLFLIDILWLQDMNHTLRISFERERVASKAKGDFMSRMSHEIRTPLNAVIGYNSIAQHEMKGAQNDEERKQALMKATDCLMKSEIASKHLMTIINDVLDTSAIESGKIKIAHERFDFKALITSLTTIFYSQAREKNVDFEVIINNLTEEWFVGDHMRINQILTNLIANAVKFTSEGGKVVLRISQMEEEKKTTHIHFEIEDNGIGMSGEYLTHIWRPFEQEDPSISRRFGGTGLGLSITKNLVDLMGGRIFVDSLLGIGTKFNVDLTFERTAQPQSVTAYDFSSIEAIVVDDDESICDYIGLLFERCGVACKTVNSGKEALEEMKEAISRNQPYTLCLVDWIMPDMDGIETIRQMRSFVKQDTPIIVLTAYDYSEIADQVAEVGVVKFISKPLFQSALFDLLVNTSMAQNEGVQVSKMD